jgi:hypothetical protein
MQTINGRSTAELSWDLVLAPKRSGVLNIPALSYDGATSTPLSITVLPGKAPRDTSQAPMVFLEVEVDKAQPYVQEQVLFTLRLYAAQHLDSGDLSAPAHADLIVENFGETKKYYRMAHNQRYEVRERQYLLFPQKSGSLTIAPQYFKGTLVDTRSRRRLRVNETSEALTLEVKAPPAQFSGRHWLPATSLELSESWDLEPFDIQVGDSHTRTLQIQALGLLGAALPPLALQDYPEVKRYPDQPQVESFQHESGAQGSRKETIAWIAVAPGTITLPELRIPWWDTVNDVERVAVIPSRTIHIVPDPASVVSIAPTPAGSPTEALPDPALPAPTQASPQFWYLLTALLLLGWAGTTGYLLRSGRRFVPRDGPGRRKVNLQRDLIRAIRENRAEMPVLLIRWAQALNPDRHIRSIADLATWDAAIYRQAQACEAQRYSARPQTATQFAPDQLISLIRQHDQRRARRDTGPALIPFYPEPDTNRPVIATADRRNP